VGEFKQFKNGEPFGAWLGIVPRQNSSGGKTSLGRITRRGDDYLRTLLIQGAKAAVMSAAKRDDPISRWLVPTNPWWLESSMSTGTEWSPAERFASGSARQATAHVQRRPRPSTPPAHHTVEVRQRKMPTRLD
jgi:hypothetical protein